MRKVFTKLVLFFLVLTLWGCSTEKGSQNSNSPNAPKTIPLTIELVEVEERSSSCSFYMKYRNTSNETIEVIRLEGKYYDKNNDSLGNVYITTKLLEPGEGAYEWAFDASGHKFDEISSIKIFSYSTGHFSEGTTTYTLDESVRLTDTIVIDSSEISKKK